MQNNQTCCFGIMLLVTALGGCTPLWHRADLDYRTVSSDPTHDTDQAKADNDKALKALERERPDKAERHFQQALIADVTYGPAHNNLGQLYYSQGKFYLAAWEFEYAIKLMPDRPEPYNNLGLVYEKVGKLNEAVETYQTALKLQPNSPDALGNLARARLRRGDSLPDVRPLLNDLVFFDSRCDWVAWAKHQLAIPCDATAEPVMETIPAPQGVPRTLPGDSPDQPGSFLHEPQPSVPKEPETNSTTRTPPASSNRPRAKSLETTGTSLYPTSEREGASVRLLPIGIHR